jgi:serine/threonine protein kinase
MHGAAAVAIQVPSTAGDRPALTPASRSQPNSHVSSVGLHAAVITPPAQLVRLGRYQIVDRIATGGMAEVYLAVHGELAGFRTPVVLKKVLPHLASNQQFIDMFLDEARIASLLDHPNVVRIYEVGRSGSEYFLAMELVQGKSLSALLRRFNENDAGSLEPRLAALIIAQAAAGLHHAHNLTDPLGNPLGLVHRDVSPQNILISFEGSGRSRPAAGTAATPPGCGAAAAARFRPCRSRSGTRRRRRGRSGRPGSSR